MQSGIAPIGIPMHMRYQILGIGVHTYFAIILFLYIFEVEYNRILFMNNNHLLTLMGLFLAYQLVASSLTYASDAPLTGMNNGVKVAYNYHEVFVRGSDGIQERDIPFILLADGDNSKFYNRSTEYKDSLNSTPIGKALYRRMLHEAITKYSATKDRSVMDQTTYQTQLYVYKDHGAKLCRVYDYIPMQGRAYYNEPMEDINWVVTDSTKVILGYNCIKGEAEYHGRHWTAWFAPDIPLQEGPWKLRGLPGLILAASESCGHHSFEATGIEIANTRIAPIYRPSEYEEYARLELLRAQRKARTNSSAFVKAQIGIDVGRDTPIKEAEKYDSLETDYHIAK